MKLFVLSLFLVELFAQTFNLIYLPNVPTNLCNDGSRAGYYWKSYSTSSKRKKFLIFLQSGSWCWDQVSCQNRWASSPQLMSSNSWPATVTKNYGMFSSSDWSGANIAYVNYCSSDGWIGNQTVSASNPNTYGWYFNGKNIVREVFNQLLLTKGMTTATHVLFAGCSAGGRGVIGNLDDIYDYIRPRITTLLPPVKIKGFADSAWWLLDFPTYPGQTITTFAQQAQGIYTMASSQPDATCTSFYGFADRWKCAFAPLMWNYVNTPLAQNIFQFDQFQISTTSNGVIPYVNSPSMDPTKTAYVLNFQNETRVSLQPMIATNNNKYGVFSSACYQHCSTESSNYNNILIGGVNLATSLSNWFNNDVFFAKSDTCSTFKCGTGCPN